MSTQGDNNEFDQFEGDLRKAERKVAGEIDPGKRALVVAVAVLVLMLSVVLPHTGSVSGIDVLTFNSEAAAENVAVTSRISLWLQLIFGIGFSTLALVTRRWFFAWIALCGCAVGCVAGMLSWWSRNTPGPSGFDPPSGVGAGLVIGWLAMFVLTFHWARVVWVRTSVQLSLEAQIRDDAAAQETKAIALQRKTDTARANKKTDQPEN